MIRTPVKVLYYKEVLVEDDGLTSVEEQPFKETELVSSDQVKNDLRLTTIGKFEDREFSTYHELLDSRVEGQYTDFEKIFVFQGDTTENTKTTKYDYYTYIDGSKLITLFIEPDVTKVELIYSDNTPYELPEKICDQLTKYKDCYKILLISVNESGDSEVITKIHKVSRRPHVNLFKDVMTESESDRIQREYVYNNLSDLRNNHVIGSNLEDRELW